MPTWKSRVKEQMRYNPNIEIRKKVTLFFKDEERKNVSLACEILGFSRSFYYNCWNRLKRSNRDISSLEKRSTKPKSHQNTTQTDKVKLIKALCEKIGYGSVRIAFYLNKDHDITLPLSAILLRREGLIIPKPKKQKKHTKRYKIPNPGDMVQIDVKYLPYRMRGEQYYQFTAIDDYTTWRFTGIYPKKSPLTDSSKKLPFLYAVSKRMEVRSLQKYMSQTLNESSKNPEYTCRIK
ncbi:MAG: hypothetical protein SWO11_18135 [Thermodesulfobacteriota bacterium]|nr:hypothetical protein [Thermodesulfobacteriota bacterium]